MKPELSIVIVNYNGQRYLQDCFDSIYLQLKGVSFEIIVVDNDSKDDSCNFIKSNYPDVRLFETGINLGFGRGNNLGVSYAQGDFILLLNNDTIILNELSVVLDILKEDESIGVLGIKMLDSNSNYLPAFGKFPNFWNMMVLKKLLKFDYKSANGVFSNERYDVDWLGGSFLLMRRSVYKEVEGFDEDYFMYVEDVDFCRRIANKGYKIVFSTKCSYIHFVGFDVSKNPMLIAGYKMYINKHFYGFKKYLLLYALKMNETVKYLKQKIGMRNFTF